jgi:hypothetical protein
VTRIDNRFVLIFNFVGSFFGFVVFKIDFFFIRIDLLIKSIFWVIDFCGVLLKKFFCGRIIFIGVFGSLILNKLKIHIVGIFKFSGLLNIFEDIRRRSNFYFLNTRIII